MAVDGGSLTGIAAAREGVAALKAYAWAIVALCIVGLVVGYLSGASENGSNYRAWITARPLGANSAVTDLGLSTPSGPQAADFFDNRIVEHLEVETGQSFEYLTDHLELSQPPDGGPNPPIALIASADSDAEAKALLLSWLKAIHGARLHYVDRLLAKGERGLQRSLDRAFIRDRPVAQKAVIELLAQAQTLRATLAVDYSVTRNPRLTTTTVSRSRPTIVGGVVGLALGLSLSLVLALLVGRLRTAEGVEAALEVELLADLRSPQAIPSAEHARERLRSLGGGSLPDTLLLVPCGGVASEASASVASAFGNGVDVKASGPVGQAGLLAELEEAQAWAIIASPGSMRRADAMALRAELGGIGPAPAGLLII